MKGKTGPPVTGDEFFERPIEVKKMWKAIESGSHILLAAPRRVGKTSLLYYLQDNPKKDYHFVYVITESISSENDFYKRLFEALYRNKITAGWKRTTINTQKVFNDIFGSIKKVGIPEYGEIEFNDRKKTNYYEKFIGLISTLASRNEKIVIMIDEFPKTLENIIKTHGERAGSEFLQKKREIRQNLSVGKNVQFIYTGSIGLENVVTRINENNTINDLHDVTILPLSTKDATKLIGELLKDQEFTLTVDQVIYMLNKIEYFIPFYIQLLIDRLSNVFMYCEAAIQNSHIDEAFEDAAKRNKDFKHWQTRLKSAFKANEFKFAVEILNRISVDASITSNDIADVAVKYQCEDNFKEIIRSLIHDGYINNTTDIKIYKFNSPLLKQWWFNNVAN